MRTILCLLVLTTALSAQVVKGTIEFSKNSSNAGTSCVLTTVNAGANALLLVSLHGDENNTPGDQSITSITVDSGGTAGTWAIVGTVQHDPGQATQDVWRAYTTGGLVNAQITVNYSQANDTTCMILPFTGTNASAGAPDDGIEAINTAAATSANIAVGVTSVTDLSWPVAFVTVAGVGGSYTAPGGQVLDKLFSDATAAIGIVTSTTATVTPAGLTTIGGTASYSTSVHWLAKGMAIRPPGTPTTGKSLRVVNE